MSTSGEQRMMIEGELQIITTSNLGETRGRVVFVDKQGNTFGSFRVFGQYPFARLILDSAGLSSGVAFRTAADQGSISDGGQGVKYSAEIGSTGISGIYLSLFPQTRNPPYVTERGQPILDVGRNGTMDANYFFNSIANFVQSTFRENEDVYITVGKANSSMICMGLNTPNATSAAVDRPFIGVSSSPFSRPTKAITFDLQNSTIGSDLSAMAVNMNGLIGIPQNLYVGHNIQSGLKYASFDSASTNFMTLPTSSLTFSTTGVSVVAVVRFTGTPGDNERIFDYATATNGVNSFSIGRSGTTDKFVCAINNDSTQVGLIDSVGAIIQDQWTIVAAVYTNTTSTLDLYQNAVKIGTIVCSAPVTDKTETTSYIGRSTVTTNAYANMHLGALYIYNAKLTATQISSITLSNYDVKGSSISSIISPAYSFVGQRLRFQNNEKISTWSVATQSTLARQPTAKVVGFQYNDTTGVSLAGNIDVTGEYLKNGQPFTPTVDLDPITLNKPQGRVGINNPLPNYELDVEGGARITNGMEVQNGIQTSSVDIVAMNPGEGLTVSGDIKFPGLFENTLADGLLTYDSTSGDVDYIPKSEFAPDILPITLDKANSRVGINNTSPQYALDVNGGGVNIPQINAYRIATQNAVSFQGSDWSTVAVGPTTTVASTSTNAVSVGLEAGAAANSVSVGFRAGSSAQGANAVAVGSAAGRYSQGPNAIAIGPNTGNGSTTAGTGQKDSAIAIGNSTGQLSQGIRTVAIGSYCASQSQGEGGIAIGYNAARYSQGVDAIAIGRAAGNGTADNLNSQGTAAVAIGQYSGESKQGTAAVAVGGQAGRFTQSTYAVAIGAGAGLRTQGNSSVAIGYEAGKTSQLGNSVAIGTLAAQTNQGASSVAIGQNAGVGSGTTNIGQGAQSVAIGYNAGATAQGTKSVAIGPGAGFNGQLEQSVAIGINAGSNTQGTNAISIGLQTGEYSQSSFGVAIGTRAGQSGQGQDTVAVGYEAGKTSQQARCVAIGRFSGQTNQATSAVAIGGYAGQGSQGTLAIAIGERAGEANQHASSIILNATGTSLNSDGASRFYVKPIRNLADPALPKLAYNATTGEITYATSTDSLLPITLDKTNNRVGINQVAPTKALDITGDVNITGALDCTGIPPIRFSADKRWVAIGETPEDGFHLKVGVLKADTFDADTWQFNANCFYGTGPDSPEGLTPGGVGSVWHRDNPTNPNEVMYVKSVNDVAGDITKGWLPILLQPTPYTPTQTKKNSTIATVPAGSGITEVVFDTPSSAGWYHIQATFYATAANMPCVVISTLKTQSKELAKTVGTTTSTSTIGINVSVMANLTASEKVSFDIQSSLQATVDTTGTYLVMTRIA